MVQSSGQSPGRSKLTRHSVVSIEVTNTVNVSILIRNKTLRGDIAKAYELTERKLQSPETNSTYNYVL